MNTERALLEALHHDPGDQAAWMALADWLEESEQPGPTELLRLDIELRRWPRDRQHGRRQARLQALLAGGTRPIVPSFVNSVKAEMVLVPAGHFAMGSPAGEQRRSHNEGPVHPVRLTRPFYLGATPVTVAQFRAFVEATGYDGAGNWRTPGWRVTGNQPVAWMSWDDAVAFCAWLSGREGRTYRLPSEAEWEYACRAGTTTPFHFGKSASPDEANFQGAPYGGATTAPVLGRPCPVRRYAPNAWGLYDMHGQIWEWCADWFDHEYYHSSPVEDPPGPARGSVRVERGGSFRGDGWGCRAAYRTSNSPDRGMDFYGFRIACDWPPHPASASGNPRPARAPAR
jgi:uncharacterized protein (TIGR02996 family)